MPDIFTLVPETHQTISPGFVETLIQARREELFTGLMRLRYPSDEKLVFTFLEGLQQRLYRCLAHTVDVLPRHTWFHALDRPDASVGFLALPVEAVRLMRVAYEAPVGQVEAFSLSRQELTDAAGRWALEPDPCIVHLQTEKINRYAWLASHTPPIIEELVFGEGQAHYSVGDIAFPQTLPEADYHVNRYVSTCEHEAWREYELRLAFNPLLRMLVNRFGELAGRALTERLCEQVSRWAREQGWKIALTGNGAVNRHYFESLQSAAAAYLDLFRRFREEASLAVGSRMIDSMARDILIKMDPHRRELLTAHIYIQHGVDTVPGVVWR